MPNRALILYTLAQISLFKLLSLNWWLLYFVPKDGNRQIFPFFTKWFRLCIHFFIIYNTPTFKTTYQPTLYIVPGGDSLRSQHCYWPQKIRISAAILTGFLCAGFARRRRPNIAHSRLRFTRLRFKLPTNLLCNICYWQKK